MNRFLVSLIALPALGLSSLASAADLAPAKAYAPSARPACAQFGGVFVGGNVGAGYVNDRWNDLDALNANLGRYPLNAIVSKAGIIGWVEAGANYQAPTFVG